VIGIHPQISGGKNYLSAINDNLPSGHPIIRKSYLKKPYKMLIFSKQTKIEEDIMLSDAPYCTLAGIYFVRAALSADRF
jgi:hypothetical protein